jgi:N-glycosylase/DNA lyase
MPVCFPLDLNIPKEVLQAYWKFAGDYERCKKWTDMNEEELWYNLCFCILSSNVSFETAKSASLQLYTKNLIDHKDISKQSTKRIADELSKPIYLPRKKDGSFRRYRFPKRRAADIVNARRFLYEKNEGLISLLLHCVDAESARDFLVVNISGIGMKQASQFLRNIKFSESLAIIDSHVLQYIKKVKGEIDCKYISPNKYLQLEQFMRTIATSHNLSLAVLDYAIWESMRR